MENKNYKEIYHLIDDLFNVYLDGKHEADDDECIIQSGIDIDYIVTKNMMLVRQLKTKTKAELNQAKHNRVLNFLQDLQNGIRAHTEEYLKLADEIFSQPKVAEVLPKYRNLTEISENDQKSMLLDARLLDILSEIEKEYNSHKNE